MRGDPNDPADTSAMKPARVRREADSHASHRPAKRASLLDLPLGGIRVFLSLGIAALVIAALYFGRSVLVPLALAVLLSFVLNPVVA